MASETAGETLPASSLTRAKTVRSPSAPAARVQDAVGLNGSQADQVVPLSLEKLISVTPTAGLLTPVRVSVTFKLFVNWALLLIVIGPTAVVWSSTMVSV